MHPLEAPWTATAILASRSAMTSWFAGRATRGSARYEGARTGQVDHIPQDQAQRMAGTFRTALPRIERAKACRRKAAVLQAPDSWTARRGAFWSWGSCWRVLVTVGDIGPHRDAVLRPRRKRHHDLAHRGVGVSRLRAFRAQEGHKAAQPSRQVQAQQGWPKAHRQAAHHPRHLGAAGSSFLTCVNISDGRLAF